MSSGATQTQNIPGAGKSRGQLNKLKELTGQMRHRRPGNFPSRNFQFSICLLLGLLAFSGCGKKPDIQSQVSELEKAFPAAAPAAPAPAETAQPAQAPPPADANAYVKAALSAVRENDYAGSVIALQSAQRMRGVTYEQLVAIERTRLAMTTDLINRADRGDAKAKAELDKIEKTRSQ